MGIGEVFFIYVGYDDCSVGHWHLIQCQIYQIKKD